MNLGMIEMRSKHDGFCTKTIPGIVPSAEEISPPPTINSLADFRYVLINTVENAGHNIVCYEELPVDLIY